MGDPEIHSSTYTGLFAHIAWKIPSWLKNPELINIHQLDKKEIFIFFI